MGEIERDDVSRSWRVYERLKYRPVPIKVGGRDQYSFLIPHHNCARFLEVSIHSIRKLYTDSPIIVADSGSARKEFMHAKAVCNRFHAELRPYVFRHGHTGQLNRLLCLAQTDKAVVLDQDCVLLDKIDDLCRLLDQEFLLIGPRDKMVLSHSNLKQQVPQIDGTLLRWADYYIHASFMLMRPKYVLNLYGRRPFSRYREQPVMGAPEVVEPYYGLCDSLLRDNPKSMLYLDVAHSGYGLGMVYTHEARPVAYHQWYSGRTYRLRGKIDKQLDVCWLDSERDRFIEDYWNNCVDFQLAEPCSVNREASVVPHQSLTTKHAGAFV